MTDHMGDYLDQVQRRHRHEQNEAALREWARLALWFYRGSREEGATRAEVLQLASAFLIATMEKPRDAGG